MEQRRCLFLMQKGCASRFVRSLFVGTRAFRNGWCWFAAIRTTSKKNKFLRLSAIIAHRRWINYFSSPPSHTNNLREHSKTMSSLQNRIERNRLLAMIALVMVVALSFQAGQRSAIREATVANYSRRGWTMSSVSVPTFDSEPFLDPRANRHTSWHSWWH